MTRNTAPASYEVCSLEEVASILDARHSGLLSIVDPDIANVFRPAAIHVDRHLFLRFHDLIEPDDTMVAPQERDIAAILQFGDRLGEEGSQGALIPCHMGVSRSTAALAILLARSGPERLARVFPQVVQRKPQAWRNSRMIDMADRLLGLNGRLMRQLRHLYQHQLVHRSDVVEIIRRYGRDAEVRWAALFGGVSPNHWKGRRGSVSETRLARMDKRNGVDRQGDGTG
ncbi:Predicted protein tyrosine phosphatase [Rhizobium sp. NFR07]|uniref:tyrosine phosphatase family protein n=1 Tax=Rhizobium sp. NFR07 TaxID=1566262 RepID=UPI0008E7ED6F|nr:protein-tyrosine-phosphatase [Rhizobium sp. NFR07]SFB63579.1 Predicted protein tyrosine phosphatase [Rhizobium sp. NFR07]